MIQFKDVVIFGVSERDLPAEGKLEFIDFIANGFSKKVRVYLFTSCRSGRWLQFWTHPVTIKSKGFIFDLAWDIIDYCQKEELDFFMLEEGGVFSGFGGVYKLQSGRFKKIAPEERFLGDTYGHSLEWI